ncbi:hypothetical protein [Frigidibacter sp.]|uniref:hypothetical protein n=1 Tax=Frigidibacter sp. TaxID=2586418 RepID=UPI0027339161|nr:hypothetical protein [Frigidibacter sp.]MDP3339524.1 hypothetical protein [Frigidibacter sp.]
MRKTLIAAVFLFLASTPAALAAMTVALGAPWDGVTVPQGQQCKFNRSGKGATPPMTVTGLPAGTAQVVVAFNDRDYPPLSKQGGHGTIGFTVSGPTASLPPVPGHTKKMPAGAAVVARAKSSGKYASPGYLPPCSGGTGHRYFAVVSAVDAAGKTLEQVTVELGKY